MNFTTSPSLFSALSLSADLYIIWIFTTLKWVLRRSENIHFLGVRIRCIKLLDSNGVYRAGDDHQDGDEDLEGVDRVTAPLIIV